MEFYISNSVRGEAGVLSIIGRCGDQPIRPGMEFRAIYRTKPRSYPDGLEEPFEVEDCRDVHVAVSSVEAYGKQLEVLPPNTTGVIRCEESSLDLAPGGWILTDQCVGAAEKVR